MINNLLRKVRDKLPEESMLLIASDQGQKKGLHTIMVSIPQILNWYGG